MFGSPLACRATAVAAFLIAAIGYKSINDGSAALPKRIVRGAGALAPAVPAAAIVPEEYVVPVARLHAEHVAAATSTAATAAATELVEHPSAVKVPARVPPPPPPPPFPTPQLQWCEHLTRPDDCNRWFAYQAARSVVTPRVRLAARRCEADCHGHGVCDQLTGACNCMAGWNGTACAERNLRTCNGGTNDGLWVQSHCAGECDETRGWCWCPGKIGVRPMPDTCQVGCG